MITFTSIADLDKLTEYDPARPVVRQLLVWLIGDDEWPYDPLDHG